MFRFQLCVFLFFYILKTSLTQAESEESEDSDDSYLEPYFNKKYKLNTGRGNSCDEVLKALGIGYFYRHLLAIVEPVMKLSKSEDEYKLVFSTFFKDEKYNFRMGEDFDEETPDGRNVKSVFYQDKNVLIQIQQGEKKTIINREFREDIVNTTSQVDDISCVRIYELVN